jgi:aminomethyltransferase
MEMKFCLYGNDIDGSTNPIEAGLGWITKVDKGDFIGRDRILAVKTNGPERRLVGFKPLERAVPRQGYKLLGRGSEIGVVTSGTFSPTLQESIGIGYVKIEFAEIGAEISVVIRDKEIPAVVVPTPFYRRDY